jgi:hypothetical protein
VGKQGQRIEIALNRPPLLDHRPRKLKLDRPIKPNRIDCNRVEIATELRAGAARKADDACSRNLGNQSSRAATAVAAFPPQLTAYPKDDSRCHSATIAHRLCAVGIFRMAS